MKKMNNEDEILEKIADLVHDQWIHWMKYLIYKKPLSYWDDVEIETVQFDIKDWLRWHKQMKTPYSNLTEKEKESDREWARKYIQIFKEMEN
jgi:hypothetical protein